MTTDEVRPRSLEHPLPAGMRDLLPGEAAARRALSGAVLDRFALLGFRLVTPPLFELADVVERGLGDLAAGEVLRFIEPASGDVAVLRPDMTPPVARIVATRLADHPPPIRLAYEGTVIRRRAGRARKHRQIPQVGVELCGVADASGDLELLELAADALRVAGVQRFTLDVSDAGIVRELCAGLAPERARLVTDALAHKDEERLAHALAGVPGEAASALAKLPRLHGGADALDEASAVLARTSAAPAIARLAALVASARARGLGAHLTVDAGEVRGFAYYTGTIFSIYAPGPGEAIGAGGRYDELLARFGAPMPAVGFGLDLDALAWAAREAGREEAPLGGLVVVGAPDDERVEAVRRRGVAAVATPTMDAAFVYAAAWGFPFIWGPSGLQAVAGGEARPVDGSTVDDRAASAVRVLGSRA